MKKVLCLLLFMPLSGCISDRGELTPALPLGGWGNAPAPAPAPAQPVQPIQPATQLPATALAASEARRYPPASKEDFTQIDGVRESHPAENPGKCQKLQLWFAKRHIYMKLSIKSNPQPGNRKQVLCVFEGVNAIANRFGRYNDMIEQAGAPYPENNAGYPPNPYDAASDPLNCPPTGVCKYIEDPNHHDTLRQSPQPSIPSGNDVPFGNDDVAARLQREHLERQKAIAEYNRKNPK